MHALLIVIYFLPLILSMYCTLDNIEPSLESSVKHIYICVQNSFVHFKAKLLPYSCVHASLNVKSFLPVILSP